MVVQERGTATEGFEIWDCGGDSPSLIEQITISEGVALSGVDTASLSIRSTLAAIVRPWDDDRTYRVMYFDAKADSWVFSPLAWTRTLDQMYSAPSAAFRLTDALVLVIGGRSPTYVVELPSGAPTEELGGNNAFVTAARDRVIVTGRKSLRSYALPSMEALGGWDIKLSDESFPGIAQMGPSTIPGHMWVPAPEARAALLMREADLRVELLIPIPSARPWEIGGPINGEIAYKPWLTSADGTLPGDPSCCVRRLTAEENSAIEAARSHPS